MPAITADEFLELHPQFAQASTIMIETALAEASRMCSEAVFGEHWNIAVRMKASHILSVEMYGQQASLKGGETTVYEKKYEQICKLLPTRMMIT